MKKYFIVLIISLCANNLFAQKEFYNDIVYPNDGAKGIKSITYWNKYNLNYYIHNYASHNLTSTQCQTAIQTAFNTWSQYSLFTFTRTYNLAQADIELSFEDIHHLNCDSFETATLAHASLGKLNQTPYAYIHFNDTKTFTMTSLGNNLTFVAMHEIGHVLGLEHDSHPSAVMYSSYHYETDLTGYDLIPFYQHYAFPGTLTGPKLIYTYQIYSITNFPSVLKTAWRLSDNYYNTVYNLLISNYPSQGQCRINRDQNHDLINNTLTAYIKKDSIIVDSLKLQHLYAYDDFWGQYTSGSSSGNINYTHTFGVKANATTYITSPNFYGATVTYDSSSGATPTVWGFSPNNGDLTMVAPAGNVPVVINVHDGCGNDYTLYAFVSNYSINVSYGDSGITVTLNENADSERGVSIDQPWTIEVRSATTGELKATQSSISRSETISTAGWPKGIYVVKVTIGKEELTEKVLVK